MKKFNHIFFALSLKNIFLFLVVLLTVGFSSGTFVLLVLVRKVINYAIAGQVSQATQNIYVDIIIVLYFILAVFLSVLLTRLIIRTAAAWLKTAVIGILLLVFGFTVWLWMNPEVINSEGDSVVTSENINSATFDFGAYPTRAHLTRLKNEHYTAVISLLHPAVVPFEPKLIADEEALLKQMGIAYIHIPMLPWVSKNEDALKQLSDIIAKGHGKYFVHCYLGKDRVNVVKNFIKNKNGQVIAESVVPDSRKLDAIKSFERGKIFKLDPGVYLIPYPTDEEFFGYLLSGSVKQIVSLLDPSNPEDTMLIHKEHNILSQYSLSFKNLPVKMNAYDPDTVLKFAGIVKSLPKPVVVHAYFSDKFAAEGFRLSYISGKPALPSTLFSIKMANGSVDVLNAACVCGKTPVRSELKNYLFSRGVRNICYTGNPSATNINTLKSEALKARMGWETISISDTAKIRELTGRSTWYLFGSTPDVYRKIPAFRTVN